MRQCQDLLAPQPLLTYDGYSTLEGAYGQRGERAHVFDEKGSLAMEFESILDLEESPFKGLPRAALYLDLNLEQVINRIRMNWGDNVAPFYYYFPANADCEAYRRAAYADVKLPGMYEALCDFVELMRARAEAFQKKAAVQMRVQKTIWHVSEVTHYCDSLVGLYQVLEEQPITSKGFLALREYLKEYLATESFVTLKEQADKLRKERESFHLRLTYEKNQILVEEGEVEGSFETFLGECFPNQKSELKSPFDGILDITSLESEVLRIFVKKHQSFFQRAEAFYKKREHFTEKKILRLAEELPFYLSFFCFEEVMKEYGYHFCAPLVDTASEMFADRLYDLALACSHGKDWEKVISNDFTYGQGEQFFVLTGPNQGGKTTFARSLGQLIYFSKMGLDVPAARANVHAFSNILTHFSVEESVESGRGKLKEELVRLAPMMGQSCENAFVIINELFTTAANYDACIMGKNVLEHFIGQRCRGIYVTHLKELTTAHEAVVSLRAMLDEKRVQCFKIMRSEADDEACAMNQVNKYRLTYEQLKERLGERNECESTIQ